MLHVAPQGLSAQPMQSKFHEQGILVFVAGLFLPPMYVTLKSSTSTYLSVMADLTWQKQNRKCLIYSYSPSIRQTVQRSILCFLFFSIKAYISILKLWKVLTDGPLKKSPWIINNFKKDYNNLQHFCYKKGSLRLVMNLASSLSWFKYLLTFFKIVIKITW